MIIASHKQNKNQIKSNLLKLLRKQDSILKISYFLTKN